MSQQQPNSNDGQSDPYSPPAPEQRDEEPPLPAFRSFPARTRNAPGEPTAGHDDAQHALRPSTILGPPDRMEFTDDTLTSHQGSSRLNLPQRRRTSTLDALPAFTPFPAASPSSRYAAYPGPRIEPSRSSVHSTTHAPEPTSVPTEASRIIPMPPPMEPSAVGSTSAGLVPSAPRPAMPSFYAPPGSLQNEKPHICEICNSGFARAHDLKRHVDTHKGDRPHPCPNCGRGFSRKDAVQRHLLATHCGTADSSGSSSKK